MAETGLNNTIPYVIFEFSKFNGSSIQYGSTTEDKLYNVLSDILKECISDYDFDVMKDYSKDDDEEYDDEFENQHHQYTSSSIVTESELTCDKCWCRVVAKKYITIIDDKRFCGACNPENNVLNKKLFDNFKLYLKKTKENCDIIYFKDGKWNDFIIV
jgi:hypothetical protein